MGKIGHSHNDHSTAVGGRNKPLSGYDSSYDSRCAGAVRSDAVIYDQEGIQKLIERLSAICALLPEKSTSDEKKEAAN
jgi:hypothetical protein